MRALLVVIFLSFAAFICHGQVALSGGLVTQQNKVPGGISGGIIDQTSTGFEVGLGYWFRLKNKRLEFTPEVSYTTLTGESGLGDVSGVNINTNILIYALDFHSDCDACPTFSKEGGLVKKGFHWIINPALYFYDTGVDGADPITNFRFSAGAGLDIGVSNLLTLVPFATYGFGLSESFYGNEENKPRQLKIGIRSIFRFDKNKW